MHMHTHTHAHAHAHTYTHSVCGAHTHTHIRAHTHTHTQIHTCTHAFMHRHKSSIQSSERTCGHTAMGTQIMPPVQRTLLPSPSMLAFWQRIVHFCQPERVDALSVISRYCTKCLFQRHTRAQSVCTQRIQPCLGLNRDVKSTAYHFIILFSSPMVCPKS